jgi:ectoine hydroxylase-related dioxygenase (phytanoyl-CoA dioxygenase family)
MTTIRFASDRATPEEIQRAKRAIEEDGYVVLEDVIDLDHIRILRDRMWADLPLVMERTDTPFNFNRSNVQQDPPPFKEYLFKDVLLNDYAIDISEAIFGPGFTNAMYSSNMALANTDQRQPVHADIGHLWPNMDRATPAYAIVVNVPLVDMSAANGSTEIWPGTHADTSVAMAQGDIKVSDEKLAEWRAKHPPIQPVVKAGSILMRDIRMWHAGMPNPSSEHRPMIAMVHWVGWWQHGGKMRFPKDTESFFQHPKLHTNAEFTEEPIAYLMNNESYDLAMADKG